MKRFFMTICAGSICAAIAALNVNASIPDESLLAMPIESTIQASETGEIAIRWPEKHSFKQCFRTEFTTQTTGRTNGKPSKWVSKYKALSTSATDQTYVFCFPERGVSGSAMYTGSAWVYFRRNPYGQLHGDIENDRTNVARLIYFPATVQTSHYGYSYEAVEGISSLYVALNAEKPPGDNGNPNIVVLKGKSTRIAIPSQ
jgi:hypothetical protein